MEDLQALRAAIEDWHRAGEGDVLGSLSAEAAISQEARARISKAAEGLITDVRASSDPGLMEVFLEEYGLSTDEGVALMCLAEALLRVPDADTMDALIEDKIAPSSWGEHLGKSSSSLVNASTWALMLTGRVLDDENSKGIAGVLHGAVRRVGEPVIRAAVTRAMKELGAQFVLGQTIEEAMRRGAEQELKGYTYSYDMLGEAALTEADADTYFEKYRAAISAIGAAANHADIRANPGISIKLSALHPRYEVSQQARVMSELVPRVVELCLAAKAGGIGLNIDAEEADRLDLSLDVIASAFSDRRLAAWDGFGVVVQAYGKRAAPVIDWLYALAEAHDRRIMVRLVKGAYWDTEIKQAQIEGVADFPVFTAKSATDISYLCCAKKLLGLTDRIYPQFATHNAHTLAAVLELADGVDAFEFQRLHGMGEAVHALVKDKHKTACRIYAPVGVHRDLLAYLVRRLLENGANSSFVNQIVDEDVPPAIIASDPFDNLVDCQIGCGPGVTVPADIFQPGRANARGWDLSSRPVLTEIDAARAPFQRAVWSAGAVGMPREIINPANREDRVGTVKELSSEQTLAAIDRAQDWTECPVSERARILRLAAQTLEQNHGEVFALLAREAGKTLPDAVAELREAADFLRYYAGEAMRRDRQEPVGLIACISPWNFPLAIFAGQIAAALAAGNGVLAKPAEATPLIASRMVDWLHSAGVPEDVLQLVPGEGAVVGAALTRSAKIGGVCFTGSTATAQLIHRSMAEHLAPEAPLIAETGGINAMVVDSTALPEQAVGDIVTSAFQSAGQRCSALRMLYVQEDIAGPFLEMLFGAMDQLTMGEPWALHTDIGPAIDDAARQKIDRHIAAARRDGRLLKELARPRGGSYVGPAVIRVSGIEELQEEIFGPVLHVATFKASALERIARAINESGYGLTFGLHTRIDDRVEDLTQMIRVGNAYVNRNQIGAIVGSQPFGGEGLSGTGPKAGGPHYLDRFYRPESRPPIAAENGGSVLSAEVAQAFIDSVPAPDPVRVSVADMPGPTGESNRLSLYPRGKILCLGPGLNAALAQAAQVRETGCRPLIIASDTDESEGLTGVLTPGDLTVLQGIDGVVWWGEADTARVLRIALASRAGPILPLIMDRKVQSHCVVERHICIDTTAAGGNASLLAGAS